MASLHAAVTAALAKLSTNRVDTLFVATPPEVGVAALLYCTILYYTVLYCRCSRWWVSGAAPRGRSRTRRGSSCWVRTGTR